MPAKILSTRSLNHEVPKICGTRQVQAQTSCFVGILTFQKPSEAQTLTYLGSSAQSRVKMRNDGTSNGHLLAYWSSPGWADAVLYGTVLLCSGCSLTQVWHLRVLWDLWRLCPPVLSGLRSNPLGEHYYPIQSWSHLDSQPTVLLEVHRFIGASVYCSWVISVDMIAKIRSSFNGWKRSTRRDARIPPQIYGTIQCLHNRNSEFINHISSALTYRGLPITKGE